MIPTQGGFNSKLCTCDNLAKYDSVNCTDTLNFIHQNNNIPWDNLTHSLSIYDIFYSRPGYLVDFFWNHYYKWTKTWLSYCLHWQFSLWYSFRRNVNIAWNNRVYSSINKKCFGPISNNVVYLCLWIVNVHWCRNTDTMIYMAVFVNSLLTNLTIRSIHIGLLMRSCNLFIYYFIIGWIQLEDHKYLERSMH